MRGVDGNGSNLNLLGNREPGAYGDTSLEAVESRCRGIADALGHELLGFQSNAEHALVERIRQAGTERVSFVAMNPAAFTHTSVGLRDALLGVRIPSTEVHVSDLHRREAFRHRS